VASKWAAGFYGTYFGVLGVVLPFLGPYLAARNLGAVGIGLATAAFSAPKLAYAPVLGTLVDRGRWFHGLLAAHLALSVAAALAIPGLQVPWTFVPALFLVGLGFGTVLPLIEAAVLERLPQGGYGRLRLWGSAGFVVVATGSGWLLAGDRLRLFPVLAAAVLATVAVACWPFDRGIARPQPSGGRARLPGVLWALLGLLTLHQVAHGPYYAFFSLRVAGAGYPSEVIGGLWSLSVLAELVAFRWGAQLESRLGLERLLGLALAVTPLRWLLLALPPSLPLLALAQLGHAASFAAAHLAGIQIVQRAAPPGATRSAQALYAGLAFGLGIVTGSALAGPLWEAFGGGGTFLAAAALSTAVALAWPAVLRRLRIAAETG